MIQSNIPKNVAVLMNIMIALGTIPLVKGNMRLTASLSPLTICEALHKGTQAVEAQYDALIPVNDTQKNFVTTQYMPYVQKDMFSKFSAEELKAYASHDYQYLNDILKKSAFTIQLDPFPPTEMGIVAMQDIIIKWLLEGEETTIYSEGTEYEGAYLFNHVKFYTKPNDRSVVIVELITKTADKVYFVTKRDGHMFKQDSDEETIATNLMQYRTALHDGTYSSSDHYDGVKFPMITYQKNPSVDWIKGLKFIGNSDPYQIRQALQEVIFKMNEKGARAQAAFAMEMECFSASVDLSIETLIIDKPFLLWIERPEVSMPIFADYMLKKYWANPGELGDEEQEQEEKLSPKKWEPEEDFFLEKWEPGELEEKVSLIDQLKRYLKRKFWHRPS